uniref:ANIS5_cation-bd domain-containing protein n=1 Tax=Haemonchus contortus TaxID=6289 RepID=A0A7I4YID9_HAECO
MKLLILLFITVTAAHPHFMWMELFHPPFLMEVSWKAQQEYGKILHNPKLTIAQQKEQIMVWAKKYEVMNEVKSFFTKFGKRMEKMDKNLAKLVEELPKAVHNLTEIMKNQNQTMLQMMDATEGLRREHHSVFHVLMFAMKQVMRKHGPHGPHPRPHEGPFPFGAPHPWNHPWGNPWSHPWGNPWSHQWENTWEPHWENPWEKPWQSGWNNGPFGGWPHFEPEGPWNRGGWQDRWE